MLLSSILVLVGHRRNGLDLINFKGTSGCQNRKELDAEVKAWLSNTEKTGWLLDSVKKLISCAAHFGNVSC